MKLMHCKLCGDIVAPSRTAMKPRWCDCGAFACWWENPWLGRLKVFTPNPTRRSLRSIGDVGVIGLHNGLLSDPSHVTHAAYVQAKLDAVPDTYIFHRSKAGSLAAKFYVGYTSDVSWADSLPQPT